MSNWKFPLSTRSQQVAGHHDWRHQFCWYKLFSLKNLVLWFFYKKIASWILSWMNNFLWIYNSILLEKLVVTRHFSSVSKNFFLAGWSSSMFWLFTDCRWAHFRAVELDDMDRLALCWPFRVCQESCGIVPNVLASSPNTFTNVGLDVLPRSFHSDFNYET